MPVATSLPAGSSPARAAPPRTCALNSRRGAGRPLTRTRSPSCAAGGRGDPCVAIRACGEQRARRRHGNSPAGRRWMLVNRCVQSCTEGTLHPPLPVPFFPLKRETVSRLEQSIRFTVPPKTEKILSFFSKQNEQSLLIDPQSLNCPWIRCHGSV